MVVTLSLGLAKLAGGWLGHSLPCCPTPSTRWATRWRRVAHPVNGRLYNVVSDEHAQGPLWLAAPLVVIDVYEHAYYVDYKNRKAAYVEKSLKHIDWCEADRRLRLAARG